MSLICNKLLMKLYFWEIFFIFQLFKMTGYNALVEFNEDDLLLGLTWKINLPIFQEPDVRLSLESIMVIHVPWFSILIMVIPLIINKKGRHLVKTSLCNCPRLNIRPIIQFEKIISKEEEIVEYEKLIKMEPKKWWPSMSELPWNLQHHFSFKKWFCHSSQWGGKIPYY